MCTSTQCLFCQTSNSSLQIVTKVPDILLDKTFKQLDSIFNKNVLDTITSKIYAKAYLLKAKKNVDTIEIANGYNLYFKISDDALALKYVDSIIELTKNINSKYYPSRGYLNKGVTLTSQKKFSEALEYYLKAKKYAERNQNYGHIIAINHNIANLKVVLEKNDEALKLFKQNLSILQKNKNLKEYQVLIIATYDAIADNYNRLKKYDSAKTYVKEGIFRSIKSKNKFRYKGLLLSYGISSYYTKNYKRAIDTLYKSEKLFGTSSQDISYAICKMYLAKTLYKLNKPQKAIIHLKKVDSIVSADNYIHESREAFQLLITHYKKINDKNNLLRVLQKLIKLDSISKQKEKALNLNLVKNYDSIELTRERDNLINQLNRKFNQKIVVLICFVLICLALFLLYFYKNIKIKKHLEKEEKNLKFKTNTQKAKPADPDISKKLVDEILVKLELFEKEKIYVSNQINLAKMAKQLKTNSAYLSRIINIHKGKNFANYINDLRVDLSIQRLQKENKFRNYSIKAISEEVGFSSVQSYSRAFNKKIGKQPSEFIKNLKTVD